jgi:hypothetical protein
MSKLVCIVELESYAREVGDVLGTDDQEKLKDYLATKPEAGVVIPHTAGIRKLRWAASGRGKRGGARVIYYFHNTEIPLFLISIFTKGQKSDLSADELKTTRQFAESIVKELRNRGSK